MKDSELVVECENVLVTAVGKIIQVYQESTGRNPTPSELAALLTESCDAHSFSLLPGQHQRLSLNASVKKRRTRCRIGDMFHGRVEDRNFYGQVVADVQLGTLVGFFKIPVSKYLSFTQLCAADAEFSLFRYVHRSSFFSDSCFRIIGNVPIPPGFPYPTFFLLGGMLDNPMKRVNQRATKEEIRKLEPAKLYGGPEMVENLAQYGIKSTWDDTKRLRKEVLQQQFP